MTSPYGRLNSTAALNGRRYARSMTVVVHGYSVVDLLLMSELEVPPTQSKAG
jgi:hypothetical protein